MSELEGYIMHEGISGCVFNFVIVIDMMTFNKLVCLS